MRDSGTRGRARRSDPPVLVPGPWGTLNVALAFLLEVAMLAALAYAGFRAIPPWSVVLGIGLPTAAIALWGAFLAPRAARRLRWPWLPFASLAVFVASGVALLTAGQAMGGVVLIVLAVANTVLGFWLRRRD